MTVYSLQEKKQHKRNATQQNIKNYIILYPLVTKKWLHFYDSEDSNPAYEH